MAPVAAQVPNQAEAWMLKELLRDSALDATIIQVNRAIPEKHLFWPEDLKQFNVQRPYELQNNIVKTKDGFFMMPIGTGRVYKLKLHHNEVQFARIDSTLYLGYNFGADYLVYRDTLFSLGGYGFWHFNGQLRHFNPWTGGWELTPVNQLVEASVTRYNFHDKKNQVVYYVGPKKRIVSNNGLKKPFDERQENDFSLYAFDITHKDWTRLGVMNNLKNQEKVADLPWGTLSFTGIGPASPTVRVRDFKNNRILTVRDAEKNQLIYSAIYGTTNKQNNQLITYYHNSSLVVLTIHQKRFTIPLTLADFIDTGEQVYEPDSRFSIAPEALPYLGAASLILLFPLIGLVMMRFYSRQSKPAHHNPFTEQETHLLKLFHEHPEGALKGDDLDEYLNTSKKSKAVQNQKRSGIIRSINTKYTTFTSDSENLITTQRMDYDRRMAVYILNKEKFKQVKHLFHADLQPEQSPA